MNTEPLKYPPAPIIPAIEGQLVPTRRPPLVVDAVVLHPSTDPPGSRWRERLRLLGTVAGALAACALLGGLGWLAASAVLALYAELVALVGWLRRNWLPCLLIAVAALWLLLRAGGATSCAGLHCGGCRR
jgi:hypothetical protein